MQVVLFVVTVLFFVSVGIQIAFFVVFLIAFSRKLPQQKEAHPPLPVSVIVCAHNEEANLRALLPLLLEQEYADYEVVVVNDRSDDGTYALLHELSAAHARVRPVTVDRTPERMNAKKYALTLGIRAARHDLVLLTDADCRPASRRWIGAMAAMFGAGTQIVLGYSPYSRSRGLLNSFIRFETLLTAMQYMGMALLGVPYMGVGRNLAYRKSLFMDNKGFNGFTEVTGGDDDLFVNRHAHKQNTRVCTAHEALVYSVPKQSWRAFLQQKVRHLSVGKRYKLSHRLLTGLFNVSYILGWVSGIILTAMQVDFYWCIIVILLLRSSVIVLATWRITGQLGDKTTPWSAVILDFIYVFYYISTGLRALFTKKIKWTI